MKKGRLDLAISDCTVVLDHKPKAAAAYLLRGDAHAQQGNYEAASEDFTAALQINPRDAHAHQARGQAALHQGEYDKAYTSLTRALELNPKNAEAFSLRASAHQARGEDDDALADLTQAVLLDGKYTAAYSNQRAQVHLRFNQYEQALANFAVVLQLDPANLTALIGREQALESLKSPARQREQHPSKNGKKESRGPSAPSAPPTQVHELAKLTQTQVPIQAEFIPDDGAPPNGDVAVSPPAADGAARPDQAIELPNPDTIPLQDSDKPAAESEYLLRLDPADSQPAATGPHRPVGPVEQDMARSQQRVEIEERARKWEELRARERRVTGAFDQTESTPRYSSTSSGGSRKGLLLIIAGSVLVLAALGGGGYLLFFRNSEPQLDALEVWKEFDADTTAANLKYKGKFVRITGKIKEFTQGRSSRFFFEMPEDAKWGMEFSLRKEQKDTLKGGETVTIRGRLTPRAKKPEANLIISNGNLLKTGS